MTLHEALGNEVLSQANDANTERSFILETRNLTKRYDDGVIGVDHLTLQVATGQIFAMLGANGAGKTTAINLFLNFIEPTAGEARIDGHVSHKEPLQAKKKVAYVSENVMLYQNFTAMQNLEFFARLGGRPQVSREQCRAALLRAGLQESAHDKKLKSFSKGMRQKCGIAIAIIKNAPAILLDEPTSGLDPKAGFEFIRLLRELRDEGRAILMSTHDIFRAKEIADVIGIMNKGRLVMQKSRAELENENLEQLYMSYVVGEFAQA